MFNHAKSTQGWVGCALRILCLPLCGLLWASHARADFADVMRQMRTDTFTWNIRLLDTKGQPIPAGTLWSLEVDESKERNQALMERMMRRYARDADYVQFSSRPGPFIVLRTNQSGQFMEVENCIACEAKEKTNVYVAIKRGYQPRLVTATVRKNASVDVAFTLEIDLKAQVDPRMLAMDELRAGAHSPSARSDSIMRNDTLQADRQVHDKLRLLAQQLEHDGQTDLASAAYYNLAYLPSVKTVMGTDGKERIVGYINGSDDDDPQRKADRTKAIELNRSSPELLINKLFIKWGKRNLLNTTSEQKEEFIAEFDRIKALYGERVWPRLHMTLMFQYSELGKFREACEALKRARAFEPTIQESSGPNSWNAFAQSFINKPAAKAGYIGEACVME